MQKNNVIVGGKIRRFSNFRIVEHQLNMTAFAVLIITGLSQKFHNYTLSQWIIINLGGVDAVRLIHRYTGVCFALLTVSHILVGSVGVIFRKWPASMVINKKDFTDAIENIRYYFGTTDQPARCDRYDYKQKFEYWGVVVGGLLMIATGLVLWFPTSVVTYLPGELIPAAKAAHTNEALLAFLVIVVWHLYNAIFSPEVFPLDTTIFTGKISVVRMKHEHPLEYERITGESLDYLHTNKAEDVEQKSG
jgi:formate dehydrogenase subunit gamma